MERQIRAMDGIIDFSFFPSQQNALQSNLDCAASLDPYSARIPTILLSEAPNQLRHWGRWLISPNRTKAEDKKGCSLGRAATKGSGQRRLEKKKR